MAEPEITVDMTKPRDKRPMIGFDIEQWRGENKLSKYKAQVALGFRNSNHYNKMCRSRLLPFATELIIRLYDEHPYALGWDKFMLRELFDLMYGSALRPFRGSPMETYAKVDLGARFCMLFGRSKGRHYQWLDDKATKNTDILAAYSDVETILSKLKQLENPGQVLERLASNVYRLRGMDLDAQCPVPTLANPPRRQKTGRKARTPEEVAIQQEKKNADKRAKLGARETADQKSHGNKTAAAKNAVVRRRSGPPAELQVRKAVAATRGRK